MGVKKGDVVLIYMPNIPEAIFSMLAAARIGAIHSLVFGGFAAMQLASRISHAQPKVILTATFGIEPNREISYLPMVKEAIEISQCKPEKIVVHSRKPVSGNNYFLEIDQLRRSGNDVVDYDEVTAQAANDVCDAVPVEATEPIYVLYTSGTTGEPKAPVRPSGGHAVALNWSMGAIYGVKPGETFGALSDLGWVVGHSYICYGPMLHRNPTVLYEGKPVGTPNAGAIDRLVQEYKITCAFTSPTALRALKKEDPEGLMGRKYSIESLRSVFVVGEHLDPATMLWAKGRFHGKPVIDHWWQTETGWAITASCLGTGKLEDVPLSSCGKATPGWHIEVLRPDHTQCKPNELGTIAIKLPLPPGAFSTLFKSDKRFFDAYHKEFPGYYNTTDAGYMDEAGHVFVMGRIDDVINVAGHRLSTGQIEEAIQLVPEIAEAAVIGKDDQLKGSVPFAFCTVKKQGDLQLSEHERENITKRVSHCTVDRNCFYYYIFR